MEGIEYSQPIED